MWGIDEDDPDPVESRVTWDGEPFMLPPSAGGLREVCWPDASAARRLIVCPACVGEDGRVLLRFEFTVDGRPSPMCRGLAPWVDADTGLGVPDPTQHA